MNALGIAVLQQCSISEAFYHRGIAFGKIFLSHHGVLAGRQLKDECETCALHCWA